MGPPGAGCLPLAAEPPSRRAAEPPSHHQPGATERDKPTRVPGVASIRLADRHGGAAARRLNV